MVAEGVRTASGVVALAHDHGVELPIAEMVSAVIEGRAAQGDFLAQFLARAAKAELDGIR
jgi:glycerol-3-phosphate dehydrogenase (NAD(P)+)